MQLLRALQASKPAPPKEEIFDLVAPYRRAQGTECIVPFSGGRDSCYALHLIVNELELRPVTYTYDWGMVTDLGRRNISRMCADLGVENIIVAADIAKKRKNIEMNLRAWLKSPHLGMISILTAGDKHFFRHIETMKKQTGVDLNLWGINPLEVTHFKAGFLGVPPDFEEERVYTHGAMKQLRYQSLRLRRDVEEPRLLQLVNLGHRVRGVLPKLHQQVRLLPRVRLLALGRTSHRQHAGRIRLGASSRHHHHVENRRRHCRLLQLRLLHGGRVLRARHLPKQPGARGRDHARGGASRS